MAAAKTGEDSFLLGEMTRDDARERFSKCDLVLLPVGSVEQHGPHLPLDTDAFDAYWTACEIAKRVKVPKPAVLPPLNYGVSYLHMEFPGTLSLTPATLMAMVYEIGKSLHSHGVRKILIINGHGGNIPALHCAAQRLSEEFRMLVCVESGNIKAAEARKIFLTKNDVHAGESETSTSLANRERLVRKERIRKPEMAFASKFLQFDGEETVPFRYWIKDISPAGVLGDPTLASRAKGEIYWRHHIGAMVRVVEDLKKIRLRPAPPARAGRSAKPGVSKQ